MLPSLTIAYNTFGHLNDSRSNAIWVCHALTANSDVADWWPHTVEAGRFLDPDRYFIVCANIVGSCYGTTGPTSRNPATGQPWYDRFPMVTIRDMVHAHQLLAAHLGIEHVEMLIGSSIGGFQAMEWLVEQPTFARRGVLIATAAQSTPWVCAFNESQRMAIETDPTFGQPTPEAGLTGLSTARSMALLSYRGGKAYNKTQADEQPSDAMFDHRVFSYQRYQGEKLRRRFDAYSYYRITQAMDSHNVGRYRGGVAAALRRIRAEVLVITISSDILFPPEGHQPLLDNIPHVRCCQIDSDFGHDGFLVEHEQLNSLITTFVEQTAQS